jgi:predicted AAA+ superfamily ATPase
VPFGCGPAKQSRGYSLVIGEHGTGKTSLVQIAVNEIKAPKGVVYVEIPNADDINTNPTAIVEALRDALGWAPNPAIDPPKGK